MSELVLLGILQVTAYQPIPAQTRPECVSRFNCTTSEGDGITIYGCAVSQDLLASGKVKYGDILYIPKFGYRVVNDTMNARITNAVDLLVLTHEAEKRVGVRHIKVYRTEKPQ